MKKKIIFCLRMPHDNSYVGGVVSIIQSYLKKREEFLKNGVDISIFDYQLNSSKLLKNSKLNNINYWIKQYLALKNFLKKEKNIILNIHTSREFLFLKDIFLAKMANKKYKVPVILTIHVGNKKTVFNRIQLFQTFLIRCMNKYINKVIFLSNEICEEFIKMGLNREKAEVLYNFYDFDEINIEIPNKNELQLLYVGALHKDKGIIELLMALSMLKEINFKIDICGKLTDKKIEKDINILVKSLAEKINIHGYVTGEKKLFLFKKADILILPSYHEGMPLVILEALSQKCAIISTNVGAIKEILTSKNVNWVRVKSVDDIVVAIKDFYYNPKKLAEVQLQNLELSKKFSISSHIEKLCQIYKKIN